MGAFSIVLLLGAIIARMTSPSDLFHQTQPKTIGYTSDIIENGRWILPYERGVLPATKPPLYNWLAVPFVAVAGLTSEIAHKAPSILSLIACFAMVVWIGERCMRKRAHSYGVDEHRPRIAALAGTGWLAGAMLIANYTIFKLGYLARPDMLVTLWLLLSWWSATEILIAARFSDTPPRVRMLVTFWTSVSLAWLTKGPVAVVPLAYVIIASKLLAGRWGAMLLFRWWIGLPISALPFALWVLGVYTRNPDFLIETLWQDELAGRITGARGEAPEEGPAAWYLTAGHMLFYYIVRSAPWSIASTLAMILIWSGPRGSPFNWRRATQPTAAWLHGAAVWTVTVLIVFSLSAGKRADYIASAFPTGAILAAWFWMTFIVRTPAPTLHAWPLGGVRFKSPALDLTHVAIAASIAVGLVASMTIVEWREPQSPEPRYGSRMNDFFRDVAEMTSANGMPVLLLHTGNNHLAAFLGRGRESSWQEVIDFMHRRTPFWLIEGLPTEYDVPLARDYRASQRGMSISIVLRSEEMARSEYWPRVMVVSRVTFEAPAE